MEFWLRFFDGRVAQAMFTSDGCQHSILCGSAAAALSLGKTHTELVEITPEDVVARVGSLPVDHQHCAKLAVRTLRAILADYREGAEPGSKPGDVPAVSTNAKE